MCNSSLRNSRSAAKFGNIVVAIVSLLALLALSVNCAGSQAPTNQTKSTQPTTNQGTEAQPASSDSKPAAQAPAGKEPYKVGLVTAFTGPRAETQEGEVRGARLAAELVNKAGGIDGHMIQLVEYDNEEEAEKTIPVMKRLIEQDKVVAIIGPGLNAAIQAVKPIMKDGPLWSIMSSSGKPEADSYVFQTPVTQVTGQRMLFQYYKKNNFSKVALLATTDATGEDAVKNITGVAKEVGGIDVVVERYNANDVDVTPQMTKIRADKDIKSIIIWTTGKQAATPIKNAAQLGMKIPMQISMGNHSKGFIKLIKDLDPTGIWFITERGAGWAELPDSDPIKGAAKTFGEAYKAKYSEQVDFMDFDGYDAAKLVFDALKGAGPDSKKMKEWIESQPMWVGAGLEHKFTKDNHEGDLPNGTALVEISGDSWKLVK